MSRLNNIICASLSQYLLFSSTKEADDHHFDTGLPGTDALRLGMYSYYADDCWKLFEVDFWARRFTLWGVEMEDAVVEKLVRQCRYD